MNFHQPSTRSRGARFALLLALVLGAASLDALAVTKTWSGAVSANWSNASNWSPAAVPTAGDDLLFPASAARMEMLNDLPAGTAVGPMVFDASYTLNGNRLLLTGDVSFNWFDSPPNFLCNVDLTLGASITLRAAITSRYTGAIDVNGKTLSVESYNTSFAGPINGTGAIVVTGPGIGVGHDGNFAGTATGVIELSEASMPDMNWSGDVLAGSGSLGTAIVSQYVAPGPWGPGGTMDPHTAGILHTRSLVIQGSSFFDLFPVATSDALQVTGSVAVSGTLALSMPEGSPGLGQKFVMIDNDGADPVAGIFEGLPEGATMTVGPALLSISYHGGDGNDVVLTTLSTARTWTGATNALWSVASNWTPAGVPVAGERLFFPAGVSRTDMTNDLPAGTSVGPMQFNADYTLSGNALTLMGDLSFDQHPNFVCNVDLILGAAVTLREAITSRYYGAIDVNGKSLTILPYNTIFGGPINGTGTIAMLGDGATIHHDGHFSGTATGKLNLTGSMPDMNWSGSILTGDGTLGTAWVENILSPGDKDPSWQDPRIAGILHTRSLTLKGTYYVDLFPGAPSDEIRVTGTVTLGGDLFPLLSGGSVVPGQSFLIVDNDGSDPVLGSFTGKPEGAIVMAGAVPFRLTYRGGDGNDVVLTALAATNAALAQTASSGRTGEAVQLTATVSSNAGVPNGQVTFLDGNAVLGTRLLQGGVASLSVSSLAIGTHNLTAAYGGEGIFLPSTSAGVTHTVLKGDVAVTVSIGTPTASVGDSVTFSIAAAAIAPAVGAPSGGVAITADGQPLGTATLASGVAEFSTILTSGGAHLVSASYAGDSKFNAANSDPATITVEPAPTTLSVNSLAEATPAGVAARLGVVVIATMHPSLPVAGLVTVSEDGHVLVTESLANGQATLLVGGLGVGSHQLEVSFLSNADFQGSSQIVEHSITQPLVSVNDASVTEGNNGTKSLQVLVGLSAPSDDVVTVGYATEDGSAKSGSDFAAANGTLTFQAGQTAQWITLEITGDTLPEEDETFRVVLSNPSNATLEGTPATITIMNDDATFRSASFEYANIDGQALRVDVFSPVEGAGPFPLLVWIPGDVAYDSVVGNSPALRETLRGYAVAIPQYRAAGTAPFPAQLQDLKAALRWLRANATLVGIDPAHVGAWGRGAGAHLASLLATTGSDSSDRVEAVIDWAGPSSLSSLQSDSDAASCGSLFDGDSAQARLLGCAPDGCVDSAAAASPVTHVSDDDAPFLIVHGAADCIIPVAQSSRLAEALHTAGVDVTLRVIDGVGAFSPWWYSSEAFTVVDRFLDAHLTSHAP